MTDWKQKYNDLLKSIKERPVNFLIGLIVLIILVVLLTFSFQGVNNSNSSSNKSPFNKIKDLLTGNKEETKEQTTNVYTVKEGDYLWKIAEDTYGSGFNAYDIAQANNITDPNLIEPGQELVLPKVETKEITKIGDLNGEGIDIDSTMEQTNSYTVQTGDYLWQIAQNAYGDPYKWLEIASTNNLVNPSYIEVGQVLNLP